MWNDRISKSDSPGDDGFDLGGSNDRFCGSSVDGSISSRRERSGMNAGSNSF